MTASSSAFFLKLKLWISSISSGTFICTKVILTDRNRDYRYIVMQAKLHLTTYDAKRLTLPKVVTKKNRAPHLTYAVLSHLFCDGRCLYLNSYLSRIVRIENLSSFSLRTHFFVFCTTSATAIGG